MIRLHVKTVAFFLTGLALLAGCEKFQDRKVDSDVINAPSGGRESGASGGVQSGSSIFDAFKGGKGEVKVNRFLWTATLDVLDFLPVQAADPFTGVITTGFGTPPGGGNAYRATVLISDPALDARSLNVALQTSSGPVSAETQRAVEDAILTRARQLRLQAEKF